MDGEPVVERAEFEALARIRVPEPVPPTGRHWTDADWVTICRGHRSPDMDDKWEAVVEQDRLFLHRSWTGFGIYQARFVRDDDGWFIAELVVEGDRDRYRRGTDAYEALFVEVIIDAALLARPDRNAWERLRTLAPGLP